LWLQHRIYPSGSAPLGEWLSHRLTTLTGVGWTISVAAGQLWYLIVCTWGMAGIGLVALTILMVRRDTGRPERVTIAVVLVTLVGIALTTSAALPDEGTVANQTYGRYLACLAPVLLLAGISTLARGGPLVRARSVLTCMAISTALAGIIQFHAGDLLSRNFFGAFDFPEVCVLTWDWTSLRLWPATGAALLLLALAALAMTGTQRHGLFVLAVLLITVNLATMVVTTNKISRYWSARLEAATSLAPAGLTTQDRVAVNYSGLSWRIWVSQAFQVRTHLIAFDRYRRSEPPAGATLVVVPWDPGVRPERSWPTAPPDWHLIAAGRTYAGDWTAWRRLATLDAPTPPKHQAGALRPQP
jgi:hypothetical protein